jgi:hypothetical protein
MTPRPGHYFGSRAEAEDWREPDLGQIVAAQTVVTHAQQQLGAIAEWCEAQRTPSKSAAAAAVREALAVLPDAAGALAAELERAAEREAWREMAREPAS